MSHSFTQQQRAQARDPIMDDDTFSLRFGNPIKVIHDVQSSSSTEPSTPMHHVPSYLPSLSSSSSGSDSNLDYDKADTTHYHHSDHKSTSPLHSRDPSSSSVVRDVANFAEFYHNEDGTVGEIDH